MLELRADRLGRERLRAGILEDDGDDVVADVTFAEELRKKEKKKKSEKQEVAER